MDAPGRVGRKVEDFAEDLGRLLGGAERKASEWLSQREDVAKQLVQLRDKATQLLSQLGAAAGSRLGRGRGLTSAAPARRGRPPGSGKKKRTMSPEARERIAAAQRKRWAKVKRAKKATA